MMTLRASCQHQGRNIPSLDSTFSIYSLTISKYISSHISVDIFSNWPFLCFIQDLAVPYRDWVDSIRRAEVKCVHLSPSLPWDLLRPGLILEDLDRAEECTKKWVQFFHREVCRCDQIWDCQVGRSKLSESQAFRYAEDVYDWWQWSAEGVHLEATERVWTE